MTDQVIMMEPLVVTARPAASTAPAPASRRRLGNRDAGARAKRRREGDEEPEDIGLTTATVGAVAGAPAAAAPGAPTARPGPVYDAAGDVLDAAPVEEPEAREAAPTAPVDAAATDAAAAVTPATEERAPAEPDDAFFPEPHPSAGLTTPDELHQAVRAELGRRRPLDVNAPNSPATIARITHAAKVTAAQHRARGGGAGSAPPPRPPDPLEIDPVPKETAKVLTARNARLPPLELPVPMAMPNGSIPKLRRPTDVQKGELDVVLPAEPAGGTKATAATKAKAVDAGQRAEAKQAAKGATTTGPEPTVLPPVELDPPVVLDVRPLDPPEIEVPEAQGKADKANVARALARLLADTHGEASAMVDRCRAEAFPGNRLANAYRDKTDDHIPPLAQALKVEMEKLGAVAGVTLGEIQAAVATRQQELAAIAAGAQVARTAYAKAQVEELSAEATRRLAKEARQRARDEAARVRRLQSALWSSKPTVVNELLELRFGVIDDDVAKGTLAHEAAASRRLAILAMYEQAYATAYRKADDDWQAAQPALHRYAPTINGKVWLDVARDDLAQGMKRLRADVDAESKRLIQELRDAGLAARAALTAWAAKRTRVKLTEDQRRQAEVDAITRQDDAIVARRKKVADGAIRDQLLLQVNTAIGAYEATNANASAEIKEKAAKLTEQQRKDAAAYLSASGDPADPMAAVAMGLRQDFIGRRGERLTPIVEQIRTDVQAERPIGKTEILNLAAVVFPDGSDGMQTRANKLKVAFDGPGTTESTVYEQLSGLDPQQSYLLDAWYGLDKGETLKWRIGDEMSGAEYRKAEALRQNDKVGAARASVELADGWFSDDPQVAVDAIASVSPAEAQKLLSDPDFKAKLDKVTRGRRITSISGGVVQTVADDRAAAQVELQLKLDELRAKPGEPETAKIRELQDEVNAVAMDRAVRAQSGRGDLGAMKAVAQKVRDQVAADPRTAMLDAEQFDNEVRRRMRGMELAYERRFGKELPGGGVSALETAMNLAFVGGEKLDMARAYVHVDRADVMAARLQETTRGLYASDSEVNGALQASYDRAKEEVKRSQALQDVVQRELAEELKKREAAKGSPLSPWEVEAYRNGVTDQVTQRLASKWFKEVDIRFGERYADEWGGDPNTALYEMIIESTQFSGEDEALSRYRRRNKETGLWELGGGYLTDAQKVRFGVQGWNMDAEKVLEGIGGKTKEQLAEIAADYQAEYDEDMWERLREEAGGGPGHGRKDVSRERFDIDEAQRGVPTNAREALEAARRRMEYERDTYAITAEGLDTMKLEFDRAEQRFGELEAAIRGGDATTVRNAQAAFYHQAEGSQRASQAYREAIDAKVDSWVQAITLIVVVAVASAATVLSGFTLGPVALGAISSVAGTFTTIATKRALLGSAYGKNQITDDVLVGAVDLVVTIATARVGDILLKLPKATGLTKDALRASMKQIAAKRAAKPLLARAGAQLAEQVAGTVPTSVFGSLLNQQTWKGDPLANVVGDAANAVAASVVIGAAVTHGPDQALLIAARAKRSFHYHFGSGADLHPDHVVLASMREAADSGRLQPDELLGRGTIEERTRAWREYKSQFPDSTMADFNRALDNGHRRLRESLDAAQQQFREMRKQMLASVPAAERAALAETPIVILSDAEFRARTGSSVKGHAATLVVDGKPVIVVREGAPITALREEGIHVVQLHDPVHADKLRLLDERRLAAWDRLSLEERMASWQAKLDLELDAQQRLIRDLESEARAAPDEARAIQLRELLDDARAARDVMKTRLTELDGFDAAARADMSAGRRAQPSYLDEPSRLFAKKKTPIDPVAKAAEDAAHAEKVAKILAEAEAKYGPQRQRLVEERAVLVKEHDALAEFHRKAEAAEARRKAASAADKPGLPTEVRAKLNDEMRTASHDLRAAVEDYLEKYSHMDPDEIADEIRSRGLDKIREEIKKELQKKGDEIAAADVRLLELHYLLNPNIVDERLPLGGRYGGVEAQGGEVNHIPPDSVNNIASYGRGPAVRMDYDDHRAMTSTDSSNGPQGGKAWRARQEELIKSGRYFEAMKMDLDEMRKKFGDKYEKGIQQMLDDIEFDPEILAMNRNSSLTIADLRKFPP